MNNCTFIGNLGKAPEIKYYESGASSCHFSIAVKGNKKDSVVWINVTTWDKLAENCSQYLDKGKKVAVIGSIELRKWENQEQKKHGATLECTAKAVEFLSPASDTCPF